MVTRRDMRREGWTVVVEPRERGRPYAFHDSGYGVTTVATPPDDGRAWWETPLCEWMPVPWMEHFIPFREIAAHCYCTPVYLVPGGCELCDFCSLSRSPPGVENGWSKPAARPVEWVREDVEG